MKTYNNQGFTLIEILVVILIFSILSSMAIPNYQQFVQRARRDDAQHLLLLNAQRLQRCFTLEGVYNGSCVTRSTSKNGYYSLNATLTRDTFELSATAVTGKSQDSDKACSSFTYDHTGWRSATGTAADDCWQ